MADGVQTVDASWSQIEGEIRPSIQARADGDEGPRLPPRFVEHIAHLNVRQPARPIGNPPTSVSG